jgi:hypothetical protein
MDLNPADILGGAVVPENPKLYVIGCFDKRITFYSQQTRALSLVHALHELGHLTDCRRIAVIGAGAAGVTAAAGLLLATKARVVLFDSAHNILPLQGATERRKLDPHIYDWPKIDTTDKAANLPVLDWESGSSKQVRLDVVNQFEQLAICRPELEKRLGHTVTSLKREGKSYKVTFSQLPCSGNLQQQEDGITDYFDMVFLAIGFGLEPAQGIVGIRGASYWSDSGVPGPEYAGRASPCFFISGNGDGGLIDFVAAASSDFDHGTMISIITDNPKMHGVRMVLQDIDKKARLVERGQPQMDLWAAYEAEIQPLVRENGLIREIKGQLRPGVRLVLQTHQKAIFNINTSALNRLAVYVTVKACQDLGPHAFRHVHCATVTMATSTAPETYLLDCDGIEIAAHEVIVRRGPNRVSIRQPFLDITSGYEASHEAWLARYGSLTLVPTLSKDARSFFDNLGKAAGIPMSPRMQRAAEFACLFKVTRDGTNIHWTGALAKDDLAKIWTSTKRYELVLQDSPESLGDVATALLRVACHCKNLTIYSDSVYWDALIKQIVSDGPAKGLNLPSFGGSAPAGATEEPNDYPLVGLDEELHCHLDNWVLCNVDKYISQFLKDGIEERTYIGLVIAQDLREQMAVTWNTWKAAFQAKPSLLGHFLCLMMNADGIEHRGARVLVGPERVSEIICGVVVSLAIASCWISVGPKAALPGNLIRTFDGTPDWTGHACGAKRINGRSTLLNAAKVMWKTDFVILAVEGGVEVQNEANSSYSENPIGDLSFSEPLGHEPVVMSISPEFSAAAEAGVAALTDLLDKVDSNRFVRWSKVIDKRTFP